MRCTQIMGLPDEAQAFLQDNLGDVENKCPKCAHVLDIEKQQGKIYRVAKEAGMYDDGPGLFEYTLKDGKKVKEVIQAVPWSSGPCIFMALEDEKGKRLFEWSQEDIDNA